MRLKDFDEQDGKRVWLSNDEVEKILEAAETPDQKLAFRLLARVGLRRDEAVQVRVDDVVETDTRYHLRVWDDYTKTNSYREPPVPDAIGHVAEERAYMFDEGATLLTNRSTGDPYDSKTVYRWVRRAAEQLEEETGDRGWEFVTPHDLRRTWGTHLLEQGVLPSVVMAWGGWQDWSTFREHYLGEFSPEAVRREREKVEYLDGRPGEEPDESYSAVAVSGSKPY